MADSVSASPSNPYLRRIADFLRYVQEQDKPELLPAEASPFSLAAKFLLPQAKTVENLAYGNLPITMAPSGTGSRVPIVKTGRKEEVADILSFAMGGVPGGKVAADAITTGGNKLTDVLVRGITGNPMATGPQVLEEAGNMVPLSRIFIGPKSAAWNKEAAAKAVEMEKAGARPQDIWQETMTARGLDYEWRQEIPDIGAVLDMEKIPTQKNRIQWANEWLQQQGLLDPAKPHIDVGSPSIPEDMRTKALNYADIMLKAYEGSPPDVRLTTAFKHEALEEAYPNLVNNLRIARETRPDARGSFNPRTQTIGVGGQEMIGMSDAEKLEQARSTTLHEIQHAIQHLEDWGRGGSPDSAKAIVAAQIKAETAPLVEPFTRNRFYWDQYGKGARSEYMLRLADLAKRENIKPRTIYKLSDWYQFGDDYRRQAGPQPKKPGPDRDKWFQDAAEYLRIRRFNTDHRYQDLPYDNIKDAKNAQRRAMTQIKKTDEAAQKYQALGQKQKRFGEMTDFEAYQRLAGEAESRLTQTRAGLSMEARRANFPFAERYEKTSKSWNTPVEYGNPFGLDVPKEETVTYTQFGSSYGRQDPLMQFLGATEPAGDPLEMFVGLQGK